MMLAAHAEAPDHFGDAIAALLDRNPNPYFVQVGGFDGVSFDPLRRHVVDKGLSGLIVEPIPQYFEKLKALYAGTTNVTTVNCAITEEDGERDIWRFNPEAVERGLLPPHFAGISSFLMDDLLKETGVLGRSSPNPETTAALRSLVQAVKVRCRTIDGLLRDHRVETVDILQIDTEGYDLIILKLFDFDRYRPGIVHYEHQHLNANDRLAAEELLRSHGYRLQRNSFDTLAVQDRAASGARLELGGIRRLAVSLLAEGRSKDARLLFAHLEALQPDNAETLQQLVRMLGSEGQTLKAIEKLLVLKSVATDAEVLVGEIRAQMPAAIKCFNDHLAAGQIEQADKYAAAFAALVPGNSALMNAALSCSLALGRTDAARAYAVALVRLEPDHETARAVLAEVGASAAAIAPPTDQPAVAAAPSAANEAHPLIRLRDLHDAASKILCGGLDDRAVNEVEQLLAAARDVVVDVPAGSEWDGWAKHYRLAIDALDLPLALGPTPAATKDEAIVFAGSAGAPLDWAGVQAQAKRLSARTVFFAAADRAYVDLYARWYIKSILKYCDVSCLVLVQVIGGAGELKDVAKAIGIKDERLIFAGDRFAADKVETKCYDTPPRCLIAKPVAHLQSVRFLRLGSLLQKLKLPVFVSDIDLILQRGVADLLERCKGADVVFNENTGNTNAGSRLTANLLLVNPTDNAALFLRFLKAYLERALRGAEVSRWIDQFALLMARHHLSRRGKAPRIDYFDTATDINNVMYRSFQEHPFRFLSLYHGFDTSSLESNPQVLGRETAAAKKADRAPCKAAKPAGTKKASARR